MRWLWPEIASVAAVAVLWLAAEQHYQGCVEAAKAKSDGIVIGLKQVAPGGDKDRGLAFPVRNKKIDDCSRLLF